MTNSCCGPCSECRISKYVSTKLFMQTFFEITNKDKLLLQCGENELKICNSSKLLSQIPAVGDAINAEFAKTFPPNVSFKRFFEITNKDKLF